MSKKSIFIIVIIVAVLVFGIYQLFLKKEEITFTSEKVIRGTVIEEVSETGIVKISDEINLSFKNIGKIEKIYVEVGETVDVGIPLVKLETTNLEIQLGEARASLDYSQAKLAKLLAGATQEEIAVAESKVSKEKISLENTEQNLEDVKATSEENLKQAYENAIISLDESYLKLFNTFSAVDSIQETYFYSNDQESLMVRGKKLLISEKMSQAKYYLDIAKDNLTQENVDTALSKMRNSLMDIFEALTVIRDTCDESVYRNIVANTDRTSLDTQKTNINTALTNITNSRQTISSTKLTNQSNINTAQSNISSAKASLEEAEKNLAKIISSPGQEDIDLYTAEVKKAQSEKALLENQIQEATLRSPLKGKIVKILRREGEMVQVAESVLCLLPSKPFQIETDIYEEDIVKVKIGSPVDIILVAFPEQIFKGRVISVEPIEKLIEGVVYYTVDIDFEQVPENLKPGMTADIIIRTDSRENVLTISKTALIKKDKKTFVKVLKSGGIEEREIEIGLEGSNDLAEVISGLEEGEEVLLQ